MWSTVVRSLQGIFVTPYRPQADERGFLERTEARTQAGVTVSVALPTEREAERLFGVPVGRHGLQPVYLEVRNEGSVTYRLQFRALDPRYSTPLEAAARCHFSILKRLSAFGLLGWLVTPLLILIPFKLWTALTANRRMDAWFQTHGFHRRPIGPGESAAGFVFTSLDAGTKVLHVVLNALTATVEPPGTSATRHPDLDWTFTLAVPNLAVDYEHRQLIERTQTGAFENVDVQQLVERLRTVPATTSNQSGTGAGDPVNLVVIGSFDALRVAFVGRWDETEAITLASCWKTVRAFLMGSEYRYSPVSPLYLFGRVQDIALQQIRQSINVRLHLRLWLSTYRLHGQPVWIGQVSRDIGVRMTWKTWNLTTHRIDPDIDESRDYVLEDLLDIERVEAAAHVVASAPTAAATPRRNLTGDPYFTDGRRVVILLAGQRTKPRFVAWGTGLSQGD